MVTAICKLVFSHHEDPLRTTRKLLRLSVCVTAVQWARALDFIGGWKLHASPGFESRLRLVLLVLEMPSTISGSGGVGSSSPRIRG